MPGRTKWFIRIEGKTVGPLSGADVRRAAESGRLRPDDGVSQDGEKWYRARQVKGLEFRELATAASPETREDEIVPTARAQSSPPQAAAEFDTPRCRGPAAATRRARVAQVDEAAYPLFRVTYLYGVAGRGLRLLHAHEILAFFPQEIVRARTRSRPLLEEADCTPEGAAAYFERIRHVKRIPLAEITSGQLRAGLTVDWRFRVWPNGKAVLFLRRGRRKIQLAMAAREAPHVHRRMQQVLGDRFQTSVRWSGPEGGLPALLLGLTVLLFVIARAAARAALDSYSHHPLGSILGVVAAGFAMLVGAVIAAYVVRCTWVAIFPPQYPIEALDAPHWPLVGHRAVQVRQPYRSARLGWSLKIVAVVWLGLVIWQTPRVAAIARAALEESNKNSNDPSSAVFIIGCIPSLLLLYIGQGLVQRDVTRELAVDQRRPLLYLRSFSVDGTTTLQPDTWLSGYLGVSGVSTQTVYGVRPSFVQSRFVQLLHPLRLVRLFFGATADTAEQSIVGYFRHFGPIVAIGKPGERISSVGAQREYVGDDEWQEVVMKRLRGSQAVLLQPARSDGMDWELEAVFQHCPLERILIVLTQANQCANQYEELRDKLSSLIHHELPRSIPFRGRPAFMWFEKDGTPRWAELSYRSPATWLFTGNAIDLEHTLRPFVEGMNGGERELPRPVRKYSWPHSAAALALAGIWFIGFWVWLESGDAAKATVKPATNTVQPATATMQPATAPVQPATAGQAPVPLVPPSVLSGLIKQAAPKSSVASPFRVVRGVTMPYSIDVPTSWESRPSPKPIIEHMFEKNGVGVLQLIANNEKVDFKNFADDFARSQRDKLGEKGSVTIDSQQIVPIDGRTCAKARFTLKSADGTVKSEITIAYSGNEGMVVVVGVVAPEGRDELESILGSLHFGRRAN